MQCVKGRHMISPSEIIEALGLKGPILAAGLAGGLLRALSRQRWKWREVLISPVCGALAAGYLTENAIHMARSMGMPMHPMDIVAQNAMAFLIGVIAMWIADLVLEAFVRRYIRKEPSE